MSGTPISRTEPAEGIRLIEDAQRRKNWKRWGPYLSERQWGTVREDHSADGSSWDYFPHEHARSRAYRWGEDGLLGITDREARLCFALALWNGRDPILKERLFGLTGPHGNHVFSGGFLGLDNVGVFDRSAPPPAGGRLEQADGTAWMAFYCATMLSMALELAAGDAAYEDVASKSFEHFVAIVDAINTLDGTGLWDEQDGIYYDHLHLDGKSLPLRVRALVGLLPLIAVEVLEDEVVDRLPGFRRRMRWFLENRGNLARTITWMEPPGTVGGRGHRLLAVPSTERLVRVLRYMLDGNEILSPCGIRSVSMIHRDRPYALRIGEEEYRVSYVPGDSDTGRGVGASHQTGWTALVIRCLGKA